MLSLFKSTQSVGACMPNNLGYRQDRISYPWLCKHRIMIRVLDNVLWVSSLMDIQNANRTCSFYHRKQTHHIKRSIPGSNAWIPKVAHIWTHLIFKLKMSPYSHILTHNKFMIFDFLLLRSNNKISFNWETFFLNLHSRHIKHFL